MKKPLKNPAAVALGKLAKGKPKTMTPAAKAARRRNSQAALEARRRAIALHAQDLVPDPGQVYEDDEDD